jgi:hypothetical protein
VFFFMTRSLVQSAMRSAMSSDLASNLQIAVDLGEAFELDARAV